MDTKLSIIKLTKLLIVALLVLNCRKKPTCIKEGYVFTYSKPGVNFSPSSDSIALGEEIILEAAIPKTFFDEEMQYIVSFNGSDITGNVAISKATNDLVIPILGAMDDVDITALTGRVFKDTINHTIYQLKGVRSTFWGADIDSFRLKISLKPKTRGVYFFSLSSQAGKGADCALYRYRLKIRNLDQHLYYIANAHNGYVSDDDRDYLYCVKIY